MILVASCCFHSNDSWNIQKCATKYAFFKLLDTIGVCKIKINVATSEYGNIDPLHIIDLPLKIKQVAPYTVLELVVTSTG